MLLHMSQNKLWHWLEMKSLSHSILQAWCLSISFGYFVYDCIGVFLIEPSHWENTFHHLASIMAFYIGIFWRTSGSELAWSLFLMELSNPLLHLRSFMKVEL